MTSRLDDKRVWLVGGAVLALLIALISWMMIINPKLSSNQALRDDATSAQAQNAVLETKVAKLAQQNNKVGELTATLQTALAALPFDSGLADFTRQVSAQATTKRVALSSITVGAATPVTAAVASTGTTATTGTTALPTTPTSTAAVASALIAIPITLSSTGTTDDQVAFLKAIQRDGPRRALVVSTTMAGNGSVVGSTTMTLQLSVFSAPLSAAAQAQLEKLLTGK
ncbi:MAG: hypothetical protein JWM76_1997 [Pseudonocardiales bacterium]|nr:hypothetical protein [Pseudonocardiales bacterium]